MTFKQFVAEEPLQAEALSVDKYQIKRDVERFKELSHRASSPEQLLKAILFGMTILIDR